MATISQALAIAIEHHCGGRLAAAAQIYRQILALEPDQPDALDLLRIAEMPESAATRNSLGAVLQGRGQLAEAVACYRRAVELQPGYAEAHYNLGAALQGQGQSAEATAGFQRALQLKPAMVEAHNGLGVAWQSQGQLSAAIACYQRALELKPDYAGAYVNLGLAWKARGQPAEAVACYQRALELQPDLAIAWNNLGLARKEQGQEAEAVTCYRRSIALTPDYVEAHNNLGNVLREQGQLAEAVACCQRALQLKPDYAGAHVNLGLARADQGQPDEAIACYQRALQCDPNLAGAYVNLGIARKEQGRLAEAVACCRRGVQCEPTLVEAHNALGVALHAQGQSAAAVACFQEALRLKPDFADAHDNLGIAWQDQQQYPQAIACYRRALELKPDFTEARNNLGVALHYQGRLTEAMACYRQVLRQKPDYAEAHGNLGIALKDQGRLTEAVESFQTALRKKPGHAPAHSAILAAMAYGAWVTPAELAAAHAEWDRQYAAPLRSTWRRHENVRDPARPLRLGFVSPDFVRHPVGFFLVRAWEHLDRGQYPVTAYSDRRSDDDFTPRLQAAASRWRAVFALSDEQLAEQIRGDAIDILFDLAGHTGNNRLLVLARKPAPIQITWIGYEGTTGLSAMDYLLADRFVVPPGSERHYREKVLRLPDGYVCYDPPELAPEPGPLPAIGQGSITFGSFSNPAKITPQVVALWARVLQRVPGSRLLLKYRGLGDEGTRRRFEALFAEQGIDGRRLGFSGWSSYGEMLDEYQQVDVALDPFPFSGSATTCEALWMGVPVITLPGETFASRHSLSHLTNSDQAETIARDEEQYVELAAGLAGDIPRLAAMRAGLRRQVAGSRLCDGPRFAGELMGLLRGVWREWAEERE